MKFKPFRIQQRPLFTMSHENLLDYIDQELPKEHLSRLIKTVVSVIGTNNIEEKYSRYGQNTYHPKLMLSLLFYGYATGVRSSRKLEEKCQSDHACIYLMECYAPDHRTISDFRKDNIKEIEKYFVDIIRLCMELGYKNLGKIYIDSTKIKANASAKRTKDNQKYDQWLEKIKEEIKVLMKEVEAIDEKEDESCRVDPEQEKLKNKLANKEYLKLKIEEALIELKKRDQKKVNLTDHDANHMKAGGSKDIRPSYNGQTATTEDGIITAAEADTVANDRQQLQPMIEKTEENTDVDVQEVTADTGYSSYSNYEYLEKKEIDGYIPDSNFQQYKNGEYEREENRYHYSNFKYDKLTDSYTCPEGKILPYYKTRIKESKYRQWNHQVYRGKECGNCPKRALCTKSKVRELLIDTREPLMQKMRIKLLSEEGKLKYLKRQFTIEPVFGHLKYNLGYRNFLLRGLEKVKGEFKLMCIGSNLKKMLKIGLIPAAI